MTAGGRYRRRISRAGLPAYTPGTVMSLVTTAPAPTTTPSQIDTGSTVAFVPTLTRCPMRVARYRSTVAPSRAARLEEVVDEHRAVRDETLVANRHEIADEDVRLDPAAPPDRGSSLDLNEWPLRMCRSPIAQP
jgi:hypothetical protein